MDGDAQSFPGRRRPPHAARPTPALAVSRSPAGQHGLPQRLFALDPHRVRAGQGRAGAMRSGSAWIRCCSRASWTNSRGLTANGLLPLASPKHPFWSLSVALTPGDLFAQALRGRLGCGIPVLKLGQSWANQNPWSSYLRATVLPFFSPPSLSVRI